MKKNIVIIMIIFVISLSCASPWHDEYNSIQKEKVKKNYKQSRSLFNKYGAAKTIRDISELKSKFNDGKLYVDALDDKGVML